MACVIFFYGLLSLIFMCSIQIPPTSSTELSSKAYQFFTTLSQTFDIDKDGTLSQQELDELFSTCPCNPWIDDGFPMTTITAGVNDSVTLQGWLGQWRYTKIYILLLYLFLA